MAAVGILSALLAREQTGQGQLVDVAMLDGAVAWNVYHLLLHVLGQAPDRGSAPVTGRHPCYAVYETSDGRHVTVGAYEGHFWATLCRHFGREDYIPHQWDEGAKRDEMFAFFRATFRTKPMAAWVAELGAKDICFGPVNRVEDALQDPHIRHRRMLVEEFGALMPGPPVKLSATPGSIRTPPATLGMHTDAVLRELGFADDAIARLHADGVV
jgi:crotonobetainyl-CoA:carnitine CoA-transferase CaiB-like acyl-CoA transferase